jgi:hypothetical protein
MSDRSRNEISIFGFGWKGIIPSSERLDVGDKIAETRYFLNRMEKASSLEEFRWNTSAFLNSARSSLDWIAWLVNRHGDESEAGQERRLKSIEALGKYLKVHERPGTSGKQKIFLTPLHPLLVSLFEKRQETSHRSSLWIEQLSDATPGPSGNANELHVFVEPSGKSMEAAPGLRVFPFCREVIELIESIKTEVDDI